MDDSIGALGRLFFSLVVVLRDVVPHTLHLRLDILCIRRAVNVDNADEV